MIAQSIRTCVLFAFSAVALCSLCGAQELITLKEALTVAGAGNIKMITAKKNVESAMSKLTQAGAYINPFIDFETRDAADPWAGENGSYELTVSQELEVFGKRKYRKKIASDAVAMANEELISAWLEVSLDVKERYYDLLLFQKRNDIARENLVLVRKLLDSVQVKYNSGAVYLNELLRAKIEVSRSENDVLLCEKDVLAAKAQFNLLLGRPVSQEFATDGRFPAMERKLEYPVLIRKGLSQNPALKAKVLRAALNKREITLARKDVLPTPAISVKQTRENQGASLGAGIGFSIPLWSRNAGVVAEKKIELDKTENDIAYLKNQLELAVFDAFIEAQAAAKQLSLLKKNVEEANEIQNLIDLQYKEGKTEFLGYLDGLRTVRATKLSYYEAAVNYGRKLALIESVINEDIQ